jgi:ABC-2 type transport system ATP-binding protein
MQNRESGAVPVGDGVPVIHIKGFQMSLGHRQIIKDLSFDVQRGETFGLLGSNGSGKTTTIRALLGIYVPTAGELFVNGRTFSPSRSGELGYLPEERGLYKKDSVITTMIYFGQLKGMRSTQARQWSMQYLDRVGLADHANMRLDVLSGGQQQKVQLGVTIMNHPELLILDEPVKGFDPVNRRLLMEIIEEQRQRGATIVMVSHDMADVERLCDHIVLLKDGQAYAYGTVPEVQQRFGGTTAMIAYEGQLPESKSYRVLSDEHGRAELELAAGVEPSRLLLELIDVGTKLSAFTPARRSLESIFVEIYGAKELTA